ncbi:MAG: DNA polymerase III subunit gamma/tau [Chloroflexi bacterium]|nr:DNA polymerase III subunit gamma/tau [Chloroflexota bacterium]
MGSQVFYRKWRPQTLADVVGQAQVTQTLLNALKSGHISHAYLFCGPRGTGKTSTGRILAKAVNCVTNAGKGEPCNTCAMCQATTDGRAMDVIEIDAASNRGIDEIRELRERVNYSPGQARYKVYIIDEVHMLTKEASNALLKTLEEPPPHVIFVLATTEAHKVLPTILSRCQRYDFRRISQADVADKMVSICKAEGLEIDVAGLRLIARSTTGSLRDAENLLEQLVTFYGSKITLPQVQEMLGITGDWRARELLKHIVNNDIQTGMKTIASVSSDGLDLRQFNRELVEYLRMLLLLKTGSSEGVDLTAEDTAELKGLATTASLPQVLKAVKLFSQIDFGYDNFSTLPLELALVECALPAQEESRQPARETIPTAARAPASPAKAPVEKATVPAPKPPVEKAPSSPAPKPTVVPQVREQRKQAEPVGATPQSAPPTRTETSATPQLISDVEKLRLNWKQVMEQAPEDTRRTPAIAILRSGVTPIAVEGETVVLSFKASLLKEQVEKAENQRVAEKIIGSYLGRSCRIRCVHQAEDNHLVDAALKMGGRIVSTEEK